MRSLKSQVLLLVVCSVLGALAVLAFASARTATIQFSRSVARLQSDGDDGHAAVHAAYRSGGWPAVSTQLNASIGTANAPAVLVVSTDGVVVFSTDPKLRGVKAQRRAEGEGYRFEFGNDGNRSLVELIGGTPIRDSTSVVGHVFALPNSARPQSDGATAEFSSSLSRSIWLVAVGLLLIASLAAYVITTRLLTPVSQMRAAVERVGRGDYGVRVGDVSVQEFQPLAQAFDAMAAGLERSEALRRQMVRDVAHELRTPLTNLRGQIEALQDRLREPTAQALGSLHEEAVLLQRLVQDLDALAQADAGELALRRQSVAAVEELARIVDSFVTAGRVSRDGVKIEGDHGLQIYVDRERFGQIVRNLVENGLTHGASPQPLHLSVAGTVAGVEIAIRDGGAGISGEHVERVWERLYRPDSARARAAGGAGLGLAIVKSLVEAHGGSVALVSAAGCGTTVTMMLPHQGRTGAPATTRPTAPAA